MQAVATDANHTGSSSQPSASRGVNTSLLQVRPPDVRLLAEVTSEDLLGPCTRSDAAMNTLFVRAGLLFIINYQLLERICTFSVCLCRCFHLM